MSTSCDDRKASDSDSLVSAIRLITGRTNRIAHSVSTDSRFWLSQGHLVAEYASRPGIRHCAAYPNAWQSGSQLQLLM